MDLIKAWPAHLPGSPFVESPDERFCTYYFTLGRSRPKQEVAKLWWTHRGVIVGWFFIAEITQNAGQLPKLRRIDGGEAEWQIKDDAWVAICFPPLNRPADRVYYEGFRGWRYFDFEKHSKTLEAKVRL